jgi:gas vesicle protein
MSEKNEFGDFLGGLILGGVLGAAIAAITTPYTGTEAKEEVLNAYKTTLNHADELKVKTEKSFSELKNVSQDKLNVLLQGLKTKAETIVNRFDDITAKGAGVLIEDEIV